MMILASLTTLPVGAHSSSDPLRIGVSYVPPEPGPAEYRVYTPESFDVLIARKIAERLGRKPEFVQLPEVDWSPSLERHEVDVIVGRVPDETRLPRDFIIVDTGFSSGAAASMRTDTDVRNWRDLAGRTVCVARGNTVALALARQTGAQVQIEDAPAKSLVQVRTGICDAAIHDETLLERLFQQQGWQKFSATLPPTPPVRLAAMLDTDDPLLSDAVRQVLDQIGSAGTWVELQEKWARNVAFEVYLDQDAPDCH